MTGRDAIHTFQISQENLHRKRTTDSYRYIFEHFKNHFTDSHVEGITPDQIYQFLEALTEHMAKSTRRLRYAQVAPGYQTTQMDLGKIADTEAVRWMDVLHGN